MFIFRIHVPYDNSSENEISTDADKMKETPTNVWTVLLPSSDYPGLFFSFYKFTAVASDILK